MSQAMTTDQATFLLQDLYMGTLKTESRTTKKILEAVPAEKGEYRPDSCSRSAIELARHIAAADNRFVETVINGVLDTNPAMIPENVKTPAEIASWYEQRYAKNFEALGKLTGEQLVKIVDFRGMFQWPAVKFVMLACTTPFIIVGNFPRTCDVWGRKCLRFTVKVTTTRRPAKQPGIKRILGTQIHALRSTSWDPLNSTYCSRIDQNARKLGDITASWRYSRASVLEACMKRIFLALSACLAFAMCGVAQQSPADAPATKEDIEKYLEVTHARDMTKQLMDVMTKQMRQIVHQQVAKDAANLPPDSEARINKMTDSMLKDFPVEEMLQAMVPVYQRHWTKGDVDAMVEFYSSPTGQKILKDMPATMAEAIQSVQPIMQKQMTTMMERVELEVAQLAKDSKAKSAQKPKPTSN